MTKKPFGGTLFRFPLRTAEQAKVTQLRPGCAYSCGQVEDLFEAFRGSASEMLLFLQSVQTVELWVWEEGALQPSCTDKVQLVGAELARRPELGAWLKVL